MKGPIPDHPNQLEGAADRQNTVAPPQEPHYHHLLHQQHQQQQQQQQVQEFKSEPQCGLELENSHEGNRMKSSESSELVPDHIQMAAVAVMPEGTVPESQVESDNIGTSLKRGSRQMSSASVSVPLAAKTKETAFSPPKKKARTESTKKSENDTASLFQKICKCSLSLPYTAFIFRTLISLNTIVHRGPFAQPVIGIPTDLLSFFIVVVVVVTWASCVTVADRDPGKRKIKTKSVHEIAMDLAADEDDSDFDDTKINSNDEDEDMVLPEDAASEDEIQPDQLEAFNDEQDLMTALWQWV